jgi:uncharacterized membrane protein YeiH
MLVLLDIFGTAIFAITGSLVGKQKQMDIFGVVVLALVTALGGGTLRDVLLGQLPVFWISQPEIIVICIVAALLTFALSDRIPFPRRTLLLSDAIGLATFSVIGAQAAITFHPIIAIIMGGMTGTAGGIIRDLLSDKIPIILRRDIYATAAMSGASVFVLLHHDAINNDLALFLGATVTLVIRLLAIRRRWNLPTTL